MFITGWKTYSCSNDTERTETVCRFCTACVFQPLCGWLLDINNQIRKEGITLRTIYRVMKIDGDYAVLLSEEGIENRVALALLPPVLEGDRLLWENFSYTVLQ